MIRDQWFVSVSSALTVIILVWIGHKVGKIVKRLTQWQREHEFLMRTVKENTVAIASILKHLKLDS